MNSSYGKVNTLGLHYFGCMTASISHEIKNALAIINENAGLLGDLIALTERGRPLDPDRLKTISTNIRRRVQHADDITRRLNRFAHSINGKVIDVSIREVIDSTVALSSRIAAMKGITFTVQEDNSISIKTIPFILQNMIWICFNNIIKAQNPEEKLNLEISFNEVDTNICINMKLNHLLPLEKINYLISEEAKSIIHLLKIHIKPCNEQKIIHITIPKKFIE